MTKKLTSKQKRAEILRLLEKLTDDNHNIFKRMYSPKNLEKPIDEVVNDIDRKYLDHALRQCKNTYHSFFERMKR